MAKKTLFLDRDGVINKFTHGTYVNHVSEFEFLPGALIALQILARHFDYIFIVTNQAGVGYGYTKPNDLDSIHEYMLSVIDANGGRIDAVYVCTSKKEDKSLRRKPEIGMALQAQKNFRGVEFSKAVVVGDTLSDFIFARKLGAKAVMVGNCVVGDFDYIRADSLLAYAESVEKEGKI